MNDITQQQYDDWLDLLRLAINDDNLRNKMPSTPGKAWLHIMEALREGSLLNGFNYAKACKCNGFMGAESLRDMTKAELIGLVLLEHVSCNDDYNEVR